MFQHNRFILGEEWTTGVYFSRIHCYRPPPKKEILKELSSIMDFDESSDRVVTQEFLAVLLAGFGKE